MRTQPLGPLVEPWTRAWPTPPPPAPAARRSATSLRFDASALRGAVDTHRLLSTHFRSAVSWPSYGFRQDQNRTLDALVEAGGDRRSCCATHLLIRRALAAPLPAEPTRKAELLHGAHRAWVESGLDKGPASKTLLTSWWRNYSGIGEGQVPVAGRRPMKRQGEGRRRGDTFTPTGASRTVLP